MGIHIPYPFTIYPSVNTALKKNANHFKGTYVKKKMPLKSGELRSG